MDSGAQGAVHPGAPGGACTLSWFFLLSCAGAPEPTTVTLPHFGEWTTLLSRMAHDDVAAVRVVARDLGEGSVDGAALALVGGALGMLQVAEDGDEQREALNVLVRGCAGCHAERPLSTVAFAHQSALRHVAEAAVSARPLGVPLDERSQAAAAAGSVGGAVQLCTQCHALGF